MTEPLFPCTRALQTPNPPFWTTKTVVSKISQNGGSKPTPCFDKAVHAKAWGGGGYMRQAGTGCIDTNTRGEQQTITLKKNYRNHVAFLSESPLTEEIHMRQCSTTRATISIRLPQRDNTAHNNDRRKVWVKPNIRALRASDSYCIKYKVERIE
jgi:hypothetical protein